MWNTLNNMMRFIFSTENLEESNSDKVVGQTQYMQERWPFPLKTQQHGIVLLQNLFFQLLAIL